MTPEKTEQDAGGDPKPRKKRRRRRRPRGGGRTSGGRPTPTTSAEAAATWFKIHTLHAEQEEAMEAVLAKRDTLVVLPTGYGKSLIYQVPAMLMDRPVVTVSPLIALMRDQEQSLRRHSAPVVRIDSTLRAEARRQALARIRKGGRLMVLTTPESLEKVEVREALALAQPKLLCIDEAHCISEWGHDFRPAYLRLTDARESLGFEHVLALTATATPQVRDDIAERLAMEDPVVVSRPPVRENLILEVESAPGNLKYEAAARLIPQLKRPGIVYCATTKAVDEVYGALTRAGIPVARYHGRMRTVDRNAEQRRYMRDGKRIVMIATSAFGMGIDKRDIRYILHFQFPGSLEQYVQEAGRAGRDGRESRCILLYDPADASTQRYLQRSSRPNTGQLARLTEAIAAWVEEGKPVAGKDLALSASIPSATCGSLCGALADLGLIALDEKRRWVGLVEPDRLRDASDDLARRFEVRRREDSKRLNAMMEYASGEVCRDQVIRIWFGEEAPPACGRCDACRAKVFDRGVIEIGERAPVEKPKPLLRRPRKKRRGRRRKKSS